MPLPKSKSQIELERLWRFDGTEPQFWTELLLLYCRQLEAASGMVIIREPGESETWGVLKVWPDAEETKHLLGSQKESLFELADSALEKEHQLVSGNIAEGVRGGALCLRLENESLDCVAIFLRYGSEDFFFPSPRMGKLLADTPLIYGAAPDGREELSRNPVPNEEDPMAIAVRIGLLVNEESRFLAAAMVLCNELAARFTADRVSLGWQSGHYVRVRATNHAEKVDRKTDASRLLGAAMEECIDQDDEIYWPGSDGRRSIERDHETYARKAGASHVASIPLRLDGEPIAAVTLERVEPFTEEVLNSLRLICDLVTRRLEDLRLRDRWVGARLASRLRKGLAWVFGTRHTWAKVIIVAILALLAFLTYYPWPYRVEAPFILQAKEVYHLPAPFDGYIEKVNVRAGDEVQAGDPLVEMNTAELKLQLAELSATIERYLAEAQLARSESSPTEMHIAISKADETKAALKKVQFNLGLATVRAPKTSFVIEGELRDRIGSPVSRGEALVRLSELVGMFAELRISERDIPQVQTGSTGELAFASRPSQRFPIEITAIEPKAVAEEAGNMLVVRSRFLDPPADWWRPGMSGIAKVDCGKRSLLWILSHRTIDYLRMKFWM